MRITQPKHASSNVSHPNAQFHGEKKYFDQSTSMPSERSLLKEEGYSCCTYIWTCPELCWLGEHWWSTMSTRCPRISDHNCSWVNRTDPLLWSWQNGCSVGWTWDTSYRIAPCSHPLTQTSWFSTPRAGYTLGAAAALAAASSRPSSGWSCRHGQKSVHAVWRTGRDIHDLTFMNQVFWCVPL